LIFIRGISYILFYAIFGNLVRWSYGFTLLVPKDDPVEDQEEEPVFYQPQPIQPVQSILINVEGPSSRRSDASTLTIPSIYRSEIEDDMVTPKANTYPAFIPNPKLDQNSLHPLSLPSSSNPGHSMAHSPNDSTRSFLYQKTTSAFDRVRQVLTPPLLTALMALVIGLVPYLHHLFMSPDSTVYRFLIRPVENCGDAAIPMILLCLGAQVVNFAEQSKADVQKPEVKHSKNKKPASYSPQGLGIYTISRDESFGDEERTSTDGLAPEPYGKGIATDASNASSSATLLHFSNTDAQGSNYRRGEGSSSSRQTVDRTLYNDDDDGSDDEALPLLPSSVRKDGSHYRIRWMTPIPFILFSRMVLVPAISLPAILYHPESLSPILTMDPTFSLALVLLAAAPTAINMIQICQIKGFFEHEMAAVLFWSYCVFGIPCVLGWSLVGLWAAGR